MFDKEPKSKQELEQQIKDNLDISTGQRVGNVATGVVGVAATGLIGTEMLVSGMNYIAKEDATVRRVGETFTHVGEAAVIDKAKYVANLEKYGLEWIAKPGLQGKEALEGLKHFAKTNKVALGIVAGLAVATGLLMGMGSAKSSREKNDQKIGEAYRAHEKQFGEAPFHDAAVAEKIANKETIGHHTGKVNSGREAAAGISQSV